MKKKMEIEKMKCRVRGIEIEEFCDRVQMAFEEIYQQEATVRIHRVYKTNDILLYGLVVTRKDRKMAPTIYLEEAYTDYLSGKVFGDIIYELNQIYEKYDQKEEIDVDFFTDFEKVRGKLSVKLINYELNQALLQDVPHIHFLDLAVVCHCIVVNDLIGNGSILIHENHMKLWKVDKRKMFEEALSNAQHIEPAQLKNMTEMLQEMYQESESGKEIEKVTVSTNRCITRQLEEVAVQEGTQEIQMYVLTNRNRYHGAAVILYEGLLTKIAESFHRSFYMLPSSIHEVILIPANNGIEEDNLSKMVQEVNETQLMSEEVLANHAYYFDQRKKELEILPLIPE